MVDACHLSRDMLHNFGGLFFNCLCHALDTGILPDKERQRDHKTNNRTEFVTQVCCISSLQQEESNELHYQGCGSKENRNNGARKLVFASQVPGNSANGEQEDDTFINLMGQLVFKKKLRE